MSYISVIVPVFNDAARLANCLAALESQTYPRERYEIIVVDNGSHDDVAGLVREFGHASLQHEARAGSYAARNTGIAHAKGDILAFTDADCIPAPTWLEAGVATLLATKGCGLVGGKVEVFYKDPRRPGAVEMYDATRGFMQQKYIEVDRYGATANMFTFRRLFDELGKFDSGLKSYGDVEWGRRVAAAGFAQVYADKAVVSHPARDTLAKLRQRIVRVAGGLHDMERRSLDRPQDHQRLSRVPLAVKSVLRDNRLPKWSQKLRVLAVIGWVQCLKLYERGRLRLGGNSRR